MTVREKVGQVFCVFRLVFILVTVLLLYLRYPVRPFFPLQPGLPFIVGTAASIFSLVMLGWDRKGFGSKEYWEGDTDNEGSCG